MNRRKIVKASALISGLSGIVILVSSVWPIIQYQLTDARSYTTLLSPLSLDDMDKDKAKGDFTKASNWFPDASKNTTFNDSKVSFYTISIPKLKIDNAVVAIGGEDLSKNLVWEPIS